MREIARASKGYWGYDEDRVRRWAASLEFPADRDHWVADIGGTTVAYASLLAPVDGSCVLDDLWVDPPFIGGGIGTFLFERALDRARELGAAALELEAEPDAVGFYERMGAHIVGHAESSWGRQLPVMRIELR